MRDHNIEFKRFELMELYAYSGDSGH
jgi:hypothetical protein